MITQYFTEEKICRAAHALQAERSDMEFILFMERVLSGGEVTRDPLMELLPALTLVREVYQLGAADALFRLAECEAEQRGSSEKKANRADVARVNLGGTKEKHGKSYRNEARGKKGKRANTPRKEVKLRETREGVKEKGNGAW